MEKQGEVEELRTRVKSLEQRRMELVEELEKAEGRRRSTVEELKKEQELKLIALHTETQTLRRKREEVEKEWRSRVEERDMKLKEVWREVQESRDELSKVKTLLAEQKPQTFSQAVENKEQEDTDGQRRRQKVQKGGGEVNVQ